MYSFCHTWHPSYEFRFKDVPKLVFINNCRRQITLYYILISILKRTQIYKRVGLNRKVLINRWTTSSFYRHVCSIDILKAQKLRVISIT